MSITSVVNDTVTSVSLVNAQKPLPPTISSYSVGGLDDTALDPAGGQTVQINGTGFLPGATITFDGNAVAVVTYVSANQLTFTSPAKSAGTYTIYVVNADGGTAIYIPGIIYSVLPTWTTGAGSLGSVYETNNISTSVVASGDAPITYSLYSGSLPTGSTLAANGVITGTAPVDSSSTTYSFTIEATDAQLQSSTRSFSLTINTDVVTWVSPANNTTYTSAVDSAIANVTLSATDAAGYAVTYTANALPTGLSLSGANISGTPTVIADSSTLLTATAATTNRSATRTINWSITVANDPYFEYNTLLIPGASTTFVDDASTNNFAVTINGDTKPNSFNPYTPGYYSNYFDGTGDYLTIAHNANLSWTGNVDGSVEAWVYVTSYSNGPNIVTKSDISGSSYPNYAMGINSSGKLVGFVGRSGFPGVALGTTTSSSTISLNAWNHVLFTRQYVGGANQNLYRVFINGVLEGATSNEAPVDSRAGNFVIGAASGGVGPFTGYISNLRFFNNAIPPAYQTSSTTVGATIFTPSTTPLTAISGTQVLSCQSNRFIDNSTNNFAITASGNTTVNSLDPFVPNTSYSTYGSGYFDGTGDYLSLTGTALGSGNFTIEMWVYLTSLPNAQNAIYSNGTADNTSSTAAAVYVSSSGNLGFYNYPTATTTASTIALNTWAHVAVVRNSGTITLYINGASGATFSNSNNISDTAVQVFRGFGGITSSPIGYASNVRVVVGTAVYTTAFTPPTTPLTAIANTSLLTLQNNQSANNSVFLDNSTNNFLVTRNGNTTQGTFSPYGGNWSNYFDGSDDYLIVNYASGSTIAGNFTWETWAYDTGVIPYGTLLGWRTPGWTGFIIQRNNSNNIVVNINNGTTITQSSGTYIINQWNHVALVRSGTTVTLYVNGTSVGTATVSGSFNPGSGYYIGTDPLNDISAVRLQGYISNQRFVNGTAIYTGNFTPPTAPLTPITNTGLLTCQSNRVMDNSINNFAITNNGGFTTQRFSPFNPSSLTPTSYSGYFDGTGDYLTPTASSEYAFATGDFTVECWVYLPSSPGGEVGFVSTFNTGGGQGFILGTGAGGNAGKLHIGLGNGTGSGNFDLYDSENLAVNTWVHIAAVRSSGTVTLYKNGVSVGSGSGTNNIERTLLGISISYPNSPQGYVTGYISNVRIVKGTAVYTAAFTPPTTPLTAISGTSLLTLQSTTFIDNSTNNFTITANGNSQPTQQNPFGYTSTATNGYTVSTIGGSGYFDGSGDYLTVSSTANAAMHKLANSLITIDFWVYTTTIQAVTAYVTSVFGQFLAQAIDGRYCITLNGSSTTSTQQVTFSWTTSPSASEGVTNTINLNQKSWNHVAITIDSTTPSSSTIVIYVNGVGQTFTGKNLSSQTVDNGSPFYIGAEYGSNYQTLSGYLTDFRFVRGQLVYKSNFVPPTSPLPSAQGSVILLGMSGAGVYDASMISDLECIGTAALSTSVNKFTGSNSMSFPSSSANGAYMKFKTPQPFLFGTGNFTVEMWVQETTVGSYALYIGDWSTSTGRSAWGFARTNSLEGPSKLYFFAGTTYTTLGAAWTPTANTWYHIAACRSGSSLRLFVDGTQIGSTFTYADAIDNTYGSGSFYINNSNNSGGWGMQGYINNLRVTSGYARYTSNFTPPTSPFQLY